MRKNKLLWGNFELIIMYCFCRYFGFCCLLFGGVIVFGVWDYCGLYLIGVFSGVW